MKESAPLLLKHKKKKQKKHDISPTSVIKINSLQQH